MWELRAEPLGAQAGGPQEAGAEAGALPQSVVSAWAPWAPMAWAQVRWAALHT